ncbi:hypothetical protein H4582DRAFT_2076923 [Lactarius indigo]|nr:hypothetical protein H4582DRAFT_2076923 [Lactarius indigo]
MHKKSFFKTNFPGEWYEALIALEHSAPLLSLCAFNWKADIVLGGVLECLKKCSGSSVSLSRPSTPSLVRSSCPPPSSQLSSSSHTTASHPSTPSSITPSSHPSQLSPCRASFKSPRPQLSTSSRQVQSPWSPESVRNAVPKAKCRRDPSLPQQNGKHSRPDDGASGTSVGSNAAQCQPPSPHPTFMSLVQSGAASQLTPTAEPAPPKTLRAKWDDTTSHAKALLTWTAKAKAKRPMTTMTTSSSNKASQPQSESHSATPVEDPGCMSPWWGAQVQVRAATSSFEDSNEPAPHKTTRSRAPSTQAARAKGNHPMMDDNDVATQSQSKPSSVTVTPVEDPRDESLKVALSSEELGDDDGSHLHLQALQCDKLMLWLMSTTSSCRANNQQERCSGMTYRVQLDQGEDLIRAISGVPKPEQPSKEDIKSIVSKHKLKRNTKAA